VAGNEQGFCSAFPGAPEGCEEVEGSISTLPDYGEFAFRLKDAYGKPKVESVLHWVMTVTTFN
jgi:hypothetical protein